MSDVITISPAETEVYAGPEALREPMRIAELRQRAAIDQEAKLSRFAIWPGPIFRSEKHELYTEKEDGAKLFVANGEWGIAPRKAPSEGLWAEEGGVARLSQNAEQQLCALGGIPRNYVHKLPPQLQVPVLDYSLQNLLSREDHKLRLSTINSLCTLPDFRVRAVLSTRYAPMDDSWLFNILAGVLERFPESRLQACQLDDNFTRLTLVFDRVDIGEGYGDVGIVVTNSETGMAAVRLDAWVNKLVCLNGMVSRVGDGGYKFWHIGSGNDRTESIQGAITDCVEHAREVAGELKLGTGRPILDPAAEMRRVAQKHKFSQEALTEIAKEYEKKPVATVTGIADALTAHARQLESPYARHQMEVIAGSYLHQAIQAA